MTELEYLKKIYQCLLVMMQNDEIANKIDTIEFQEVDNKIKTK